MRSVQLAFVALALGACHDIPKSCDMSAAPVCVGVSTDTTSLEELDGGAGLELVVNAYVPCLVGDIRAYVTTSTGTIDGTAPGMPAIVYLAPVPGLPQDGHVVGRATLVLGAAQTAIVEIALNDQVTSISLQASTASDAGVMLTPTGGASACAGP